MYKKQAQLNNGNKTKEMASNVSTVDGMGFEEVNQDQSFTETISGTNLYGDNLWINTRGQINDISGATGSFGAMNITQDLNVGDAIDCVTIQERERQLCSTSTQNATELFGYKVKAGSVETDNSGEGVIAFVDAGSFSTLNYFMTITPREWSVVIESGTNWGASGVRRASGCEMVGPSGTVFDWIAVVI